MESYNSIDEYIAAQSKEFQKPLKQLRSLIQSAAPKAEEAMKYAMPTFTLGRNLVHFSAWKNHIGFYPAPSGIIAFQKELKKYKTSKGAIQFPIDEPLPEKLIKQIVKFRVAEEKERLQKKK